jgi:hypothetical protein
VHAVPRFIVSCPCLRARRTAAGFRKPALHHGVLYKTQWGHQQEFLQLFLKNHYPLLKQIVESGRALSLKIETPANHMTEDARWDYRVTIKFKNSTVATTANPDEASLIKQLWPDQETYKREEQRRFEILLAHWDLPVSDVTPAEK